MSASSSSSPEALVASGAFRVERVRRSGWAPLVSPFFTLASSLPIAADTVSGRDRAKTLKIALVITGVIILLGAREVHFALAPLGLAIMASAVWLPVTDLRKRGLVRRAREMMQVVETEDEPARLEHDGRRLILWKGEDRARRVLTNRPFDLTLGELEGRAVLAVRAKGKGGKRESICALGPAGSGEGYDTFSRDRLFEPVYVESSAEWEGLVARTREAHDEARTPRR